jgi:hypothetical protein
MSEPREREQGSGENYAVKMFGVLLFAAYFTNDEAKEDELNRIFLYHA